MTTYKLQFINENGFWQNVSNARGVDVELLSIDDANFVAGYLAEAGYRNAFDAHKWRTCDSHGVKRNCISGNMVT